LPHARLRDGARRAHATDREESYANPEPRDHFGEISLIDGLAPSASVVAEEAVETLSISHDDLKDLMATDLVWPPRS